MRSAPYTHTFISRDCPHGLSISCISACPTSTDAPTASTWHSRDLLKSGLSVEHLVLVAAWREAGNLFDEQEKAALAWAEAVTRLGDRGVSDAAFEAASAVFNEKQLADLTLAIGLMNAYNRLSISFRTTPLAVAKHSGEQRSTARTTP
jgi:hypothetical protein